MSHSVVAHFYRTPGLATSNVKEISNKVAQFWGPVDKIETEYCFNANISEGSLSQEEEKIITWLLSETFESDKFARQSFLVKKGTTHLLEFGPRLNFSTAWSTNAITILNVCGVSSVNRIERSRRILITLQEEKEISPDQFNKLVNSLHDTMTECLYSKPLDSFVTNMRPEPWAHLPVLKEGRKALEEFDKKMSLAFDDWDFNYYTKLFQDMKRDPTTVECFDLSQSNSEHSRHWFFGGRIVIDGKEIQQSLFKLVKETLEHHKTNSTIAFSDNSSAIKGYNCDILKPVQPGKPSIIHPELVSYDITFTAETHNFPTGVAPFPGAETGTGGRIRDGHATGRGSLVIAGTTGYSVGNLQIPGYILPWENTDWEYSQNFATPLEIEISASNGASDYGNKFGEPVIAGFTRSFGLQLPDGERREYVKPIMFTGGIGQMSHTHIKKGKPEVGMYVVKLGGPAYRVGIGGGAASSLTQGENDVSRDFAAVQRGDAEMECKVNRAIRACVELGEANPIISIHDQGAGGNANVLKEIVDPTGARIEVRNILVADESLSVLEIWCAEYQESDALLIWKKDAELFSQICLREGAPFAIVGEITGDARIVLHDSRDDSTPVCLELPKVLADMPRKTFNTTRKEVITSPLRLPQNTTVILALDRVLRLLSVGSKRFLTNKVDRSVTGLIAQQQCVGPLHIPLADFAMIAQSHLGKTGAVTAIGEQPIKGLLSPSAMARMTVGEALTNIVFAKIDGGLDHIKASGNWMWPAKLPFEGAAMYFACQALRDILVQLGVAIDGGKDSVSMAAKIGKELVKVPGTLVMSLYATTSDITKKVTPDLRYPSSSTLIFIDLAAGKNRIGGSALAQVYSQIADVAPDMDSPEDFIKVWNCIQYLVENKKISAGHDRSDGGLIVTLLEMAFTGNCGFDIRLPPTSNLFDFLFAEELGVVIEVQHKHVEEVVNILIDQKVLYFQLGSTTINKEIRIVDASNQPILVAPMPILRNTWEATSFELEKLQANTDCVLQEQAGLTSRPGPNWKLTFTPKLNIEGISLHRPPVAIIREEGSHGDREMAAAFYTAGFEVWDVKMSDIKLGSITLSNFIGVAFVGGFSYADVMDSAKGWAGSITHNPKVLKEFDTFYKRKDTFSLGICNGCQLMALLGWIPYYNTPIQHQPRFIHNQSARFESRFVNVKILESPSIMLKGMESSCLGVWVQHGEGRAYFPDQQILSSVLSSNLAPIRYVDDLNNLSMEYPYNPNGSIHSIAGMCSEDGRHLALMPHPERTFLKWQWPWMPPAWDNLEASPWLRMFQNARLWVDNV